MGTSARAGAVPTGDIAGGAVLTAGTTSMAASPPVGTGAVGHGVVMDAAGSAAPLGVSAGNGKATGGASAAAA